MALVNVAGPESFRVDTVVFAANAPVALTDLDISAVVGAREVLADIEVSQSGGADESYDLRMNGAILRQLRSGVMAGVCATGSGCTFKVPTDANGIIEWTIQGVTEFTTVTVKGYRLQGG